MVESNVASMDDLAKKISELEAVETIQCAALFAQANKLRNDIRPSSLLKSAFAGLTSSKTLQHGAIDTSLGLGAGWLVKKLVQSGSKNIFRRLAGTVLQTVATGIFTSKMPLIRQKITGHQ
jgi:hypothetical protein